MSDTTGPGSREHYWSMEHYGFTDHEPAAASQSSPGAHAPRPPRTAMRPRALLGTTIAALALSGTIGFVAAQASADQPPQGDGGGVVQVDGPGPGGGRDGGPRGGGR